MGILLLFFCQRIILLFYIGGGFFNSRRHILAYIPNSNIIINITNITHLLLTFVETIIFTISRNVHIVLFIYILYLCMPTKCKFFGK